jgi:hypothetical protein
MNNMPKKVSWLFMVVCMVYWTIPCSAQKDTVKNFKNTIHINITNPMLFGDKYNVIGYERVFKNNQSVSFGMGRFSLPGFGFIDYDSLELKKGYSEKGFTFIAEYRFYLKKENKYSAPRGIYVGPYYSYNYLERTNSWSLNNVSNNLETNMKFNANLVGAQMGYQFVFWNRLSLDLVFMGPGVWFYSIKTKISTTLDAEQEALLFEKINELLAAKLPGHEITINPGDKQKTGSFHTTSGGWRYLIQLGFRF